MWPASVISWTYSLGATGPTCRRSTDELQEYFVGGDRVIPDPQRLAERLEMERQGCRRIVFTNGVFDILHRGHVTYFNQAKALGHVLVVGVNTDESVRRRKGPQRPINALEDRLQVLAGVSSVDYVVPAVRTPRRSCSRSCNLMFSSRAAITRARPCPRRRLWSHTAGWCISCRMSRTARPPT
jgi:cytidyltransferase-like protein